MVLNTAAFFGLPVTLEVTERGLQLPEELRFSAADLRCTLLTLGSGLVIQTGGYQLRATVAGADLKPYKGTKTVTCHKGHFYLNIPAATRKQLPQEIEFRILIDVESL